MGGIWITAERGGGEKTCSGPWIGVSLVGVLIEKGR